MTTPHLPPGVAAPTDDPVVVPIGRTVGTAAGHRLVLLSLERWPGWADLRFARVGAGGPPLARRVPPPEAWTVEADGRQLTVVDAIGRGDRAFSNGEVRVVPPPTDARTLRVRVEVAPGAVVDATVPLDGSA